MENADWISLAALVLTMLLMLRVISLNKRVNELQSQLERINSRSGMDGGFTKTGMDTPTPQFVQNFDLMPDLENRLRLLLAEGKKIQAIKVLREARDLSLKDAKDYIDNLERRY